MTATKRKTVPPSDDPVATPVVENATAPPPAREKRAPAKSTVEGQPAAFPIVGIGASAGGLAAIEEFLAALPAERCSDLALVIVQHLDPDHKSILLELVAKYTQLDVAWAKDGVEVRRGAAYVLPPNKDMALVGGHLVLVDPELPRGRRLPIDYFFRSLAADQHEHAVCVVLSGTGSDGTLGLRAVKGEGGLAIVQSPESAAYDGMPRSAIATGLVDYVLAPREMPDQLLGYVSRAFGRARAGRPDPVIDADSAPLLQVLRLLRDRTGHDFTHYKSNTLRRRVERRMAICRVERISDYVKVLQKDSLEVETLFRELLIGVTSFFRDPGAFDALGAEVLPRIIRARAAGDPVRLWVPGCSTGEEAYSIVMLLREQIESVKRNVIVQAFATDIDAEAIERARAGTYPESIAADVTPERLERFFTKDGETYRVAKAIRDCVVFAKQDVTKDPPFSRVDLISCRNLLIYMDSELQRRIMPLFHYAINPDGYLFLGTSETVGDATDLFAPVDKKWKLFQRRNSATSGNLVSTQMPTVGFTRAHSERLEGAAAPMRVRVRVLAEQALLDRHVPSCAVVNADGDVLYIHGHTGRYLEPPIGEPTGSIVKMARDGIRIELITGMRKALAEEQPVRYERLRVKSDEEVSLVNLTIEPLPVPNSDKGVLLVLFEDVSAPSTGDAVSAEPAADREQRIADLDRELSDKEEYLHSTIEELETSNEELKSTNEEMQSSNEELQSTNEELETSREELQSVNEELITVNGELQQKIDELYRANNDMNNMFAGTGIGTLFVDSKLRIQRFSPTVRQVMSLIPTDVGRPLGDMAQRLKGGVDIVGAVSDVLNTLNSVDSRVEAPDGSIYQMRIQPYRTLDNVIEGAVLTFVDITDQQRIQAERDDLARSAEAAGEFAQGVLDSMREPQLVLDGDLAVVTANQAFLAVFELSSDAVVGHQLSEIDDGAWRDDELSTLLKHVLPEKRTLGDHQLRLAQGTPKARTITVNALELVRLSPAKRRLILLTVTNVGGA